MSTWGEYCVIQAWPIEFGQESLRCAAYYNWQINSVGGLPRVRLRKPKRERSSAEWRELREFVFARDDYTCRYCGIRGGRLECDHVHPMAKGGKSAHANLVTSCKPCNRSKRDKTLAEWSVSRHVTQGHSA